MSNVAVSNFRHIELNLNPLETAITLNSAVDNSIKKILRREQNHLAAVSSSNILLNMTLLYRKLL